MVWALRMRRSETTSRPGRSSTRNLWLHSVDMRVEERLRREGDTLHYEVTVHDPGVLVDPWVMDPEVLRLNIGFGKLVLTESTKDVGNIRVFGLEPTGKIFILVL